MTEPTELATTIAEIVRQEFRALGIHETGAAEAAQAVAALPAIQGPVRFDELPRLIAYHSGRARLLETPQHGSVALASAGAVALLDLHALAAASLLLMHLHGVEPADKLAALESVAATEGPLGMAAKLKLIDLDEPAAGPALAQKLGIPIASIEARRARLRQQQRAVLN